MVCAAAVVTSKQTARRETIGRKVRVSIFTVVVYNTGEDRKKISYNSVHDCGKSSEECIACALVRSFHRTSFISRISGWVFPANIRNLQRCTADSELVWRVWLSSCIIICLASLYLRKLRKSDKGVDIWEQDYFSACVHS